MSLQPISNRVLIKPIEPEQKGLIVDPTGGKNRCPEAIVEKIGPGKIHEKTGLLQPMSVRVGDRILYVKHSGTEIQHEGVTYQIIKDPEDILAVISTLASTPQVETPAEQ